VVRRTLDRLLAWLARLVAAGFFRTTEIEGLSHVGGHGPVVLVANHFNGFVDAIALVASLGRLPRFLAKATLWKIPLVRPLLWGAGLIPVHRRVDDAERESNVRAFEAAEATLRAGQTIAIFPEGTTHDEPRLAPIRTGAARIALGAAARGVRGVKIVPVGITFEDKVSLRTRVLVRAGRPISVDDDVSDLVGDATRVTDEDHDAVRRVTDEIAARILDVSPDFDTFLEGAALAMAADVTLREEVVRPREPVPLGRREALAARLADLPAAPKQRIVDQLGRYGLALDALHVTDDQLVPRIRARSVLGRVVRLLVAVIVLAPFALAGVLINAIPAAIVGLAGLAVRTPVTKGTVRVLVGLVVFPLTWLALAWFDTGATAIESLLAAFSFPLDQLVDVVFDGREGFWPSLFVFVTAPIFGLCAVYLLDRVFTLIREWYGWHALVARRGQLVEVLRLRAELVAAVRRAVGDSGDVLLVREPELGRGDEGDERQAAAGGERPDRAAAVHHGQQ
jgi:1-acyl-sn-glycerol-3-phosphate acyltransferase